MCKYLIICFFLFSMQNQDVEKYQFKGVVKMAQESSKDFALVVETKPNDGQTFSTLFSDKSKITEFIKTVAVGDSIYLKPSKNLIKVIKFSNKGKRTEKKFILP